MEQTSVLRISCFHPKEIVNRKYISALEDYTNIGIKIQLSSFQHNPDYLLRVPCGKCLLCRRKRASEWRLRLMAEAQSEQNIRNVLFLTFTFNDKYYQSYLDDKSVFIRRWRQNFKYKYGFAPRYFLIEDCGSQFGRIHLHGFLFNVPKSKITTLRKERLCWKYGFVDLSFCKSLKAISYACGYITGASLKKDALKHGKPVCEKAKKFIGKIFVSKGLGRAFVDLNKSEFRSRTENHFLVRQGLFNVALPRYYRNKIWTVYELEWIKNDYQIEQFENYQNFNPNSFVVPFEGKNLSSSHFAQVAKFSFDNFEEKPDDFTVLFNGQILSKPIKQPDFLLPNEHFDFQTPKQLKLL